MKRGSRWLLRGTLGLMALGALGFLGAASGVVPIAASSGHFAITHWFLHFSMRRSVSTHALAVTKPARDEPWRVLKGAGHFETGCKPCHGEPDLEPPVVGRAMLPAPPFLTPRVSHWDDRELFYIVKHGVKFTGMPAWPSQQRDDEVWAVVDFLRELPNLDAASYRALVHSQERFSQDPLPLSEFGANETASIARQKCARCHGGQGEGRNSAAFPKLAGQKSEYQIAALQAYAKGKRHSGIMEPIAAGLSAVQMRALSESYAALQARQEPPSLELSTRALRGRAIAEQGIASQGVPACRECHGPAPSKRNSHYPKLAGQYADYLFLQLELLKARRRGGSPYLHIMQRVAARLEEAQMREVAEYYASLPPEPSP